MGVLGAGQLIISKITLITFLILEFVFVLFPTCDEDVVRIELANIDLFVVSKFQTFAGLDVLV